MIISKVCGGLGNQMFQYAAGRALALRLEMDLKLDLSWYSNIEGSTPREFMLAAFPHIKVEVASEKEIRAFRDESKLLHTFSKKIKSSRLSYIREPHFQYWAGIEKIGGTAYIDGYWQTERYFASAWDVIRRDFMFPALSSIAAKKIAEQILINPEATAVHIRRGDYVSLASARQFHGLCSPEYYSKSIETVSFGVKDVPHFFLFSDEPAWVKKEFSCFDFPVTVVDLPSQATAPWHDMHLMSLCKHHIIANSSFSWWGAWLANRGGVVCAPAKWFLEPRINTQDVCPTRWKRIVAEKRYGMPLYPDVSVILSVYNGETFLEEAIQSILAQSLVNFELIVVDDASTDSTAQILETYAKMDGRIRILRNESNQERSVSRNRAIAASRSNLIAVMDADDYAFPHRLAEQVRFMQENPEVSVCGGALQLYERPEEIWTPPQNHEGICAAMLFNSAIYHPTAIFRRDAALSVGGYDISSPFAEDYALWVKLGVLEGKRLANMNSVLIRYRTHNGRSAAYQKKINTSADNVRKVFLNKIGLMPFQREWDSHVFLSTADQALNLSEVCECKKWIKKITKSITRLSPEMRKAIINELFYRWKKLFALQKKKSFAKSCVFFGIYLRLLYYKYSLACANRS